MSDATSTRQTTERVTLGTTGVTVTRLGLGCAPIGNLYEPLSDDQAVATVRAAFDAGVRFFDTAPLYGHGLAERRLGLALAELPRDEIVVATKVGRVLEDGVESDTIFRDVPPVRPVFDYTAGGVDRSLTDSLERLGLDRVDVVHVHDPDDHVAEALDTAFPALHDLRDAGVIGAVGAGMNQSAALARFVRAGAVDCVLLAGRWTLLDRTGADELLPLCAARNVSVIAAGVFNSGLLADPRPGATFDYVEAPPDLVERAQRLRDRCVDLGTSLQAAALQFPLRHPAVACVLTGVRSVDEARANVEHFDAEVPAEVWSELG